MGRNEIVCHGDVGSHNTVHRGGVPVGFIDWDTVCPNDPLVEFGMAAWKFVLLGTDAYFEASGFGSQPDLGHRLALFAREYGVRDGVNAAWPLQQAKQRSVEVLGYFPDSPAEAAAALRLVANDLEWLQQALDTIVALLD
ncbi:MAG TPA: phosphotransferase [Acidimicrobiales bacterium]|nr:phosphotransferase [Acidimicrobiales bacterium]